MQRQVYTVSMKMHHTCSNIKEAFYRGLVPSLASIILLTLE